MNMAQIAFVSPPMQPLVQKASMARMFPFTATGDAMEPTMRAGRDVAIVEPCAAYQGAGLYLLQLDGVDQIRRVQWTGKAYDLACDNPAYSTTTNLTADALQSTIIGRVAYVCQAQAHG